MDAEPSDPLQRCGTMNGDRREEFGSNLGGGGTQDRELGTKWENDLRRRRVFSLESENLAPQCREILKLGLHTTSVAQRRAIAMFGFGAGSPGDAAARTISGIHRMLAPREPRLEIRKRPASPQAVVQVEPAESLEHRRGLARASEAPESHAAAIKTPEKGLVAWEAPRKPTIERGSEREVSDTNTDLEMGKRPLRHELVGGLVRPLAEQRMGIEAPQVGVQQVHEDLLGAVVVAQRVEVDRPLEYAAIGFVTRIRDHTLKLEGLRPSPQNAERPEVERLNIDPRGFDLAGHVQVAPMGPALAHPDRHDLPGRGVPHIGARPPKRDFLVLADRPKTSRTRAQLENDGVDRRRRLRVVLWLSGREFCHERRGAACPALVGAHEERPSALAREHHIQQRYLPRPPSLTELGHDSAPHPREFDTIDLDPLSDHESEHGELQRSADRSRKGSQRRGVIARAERRRSDEVVELSVLPVGHRRDANTRRRSEGRSGAPDMPSAPRTTYCFCFWGSGAEVFGGVAGVFGWPC